MDMLEVIRPLRKEPPLPRQAAMGFFTDTSLCIGCKACEVACKQWNQLPGSEPEWRGSSYDNTGQLSAQTWRHVQFIEQVGQRRPGITIEEQIAEAKSNGDIPQSAPGMALPFFNSERWLMHSDVCKHCANAPCLEACPTGAIIRTEFDTVYVQQDICNGCGYCVVACPFGVIERDEVGDHRAHKCTLCYDRLKDDLEPACAKACPTDSIKFGDLEELREIAAARVGQLQEQGMSEAYLYGADAASQPGTEGLNAFFLLVDKPEAYNLPPDPIVPTRTAKAAWMSLAWAALGMVTVAVASAFASIKTRP